jgi:hypothetical protein
MLNVNTPEISSGESFESIADNVVNESPVSISPFGLPPETVGPVDTSDDNLDMFDPEKLRVSQEFVEESGVEKVQGVIAVRKPNKQEFFRVHPEIQLLVAVIENSEDREMWIVVPELVASVNDEVSFAQLRLTVNRYGVAFVWPLKVSRDGKSNTWNMSAMTAADNATSRWVRMKSNQSAAQYNVVTAKIEYGEPEWPDMSFKEILELAFKGRVIKDNNHPLLQQLRGEI